MRQPDSAVDGGERAGAAHDVAEGHHQHGSALHGAQSLIRARESIHHNSDQLASFRADPHLYLQRFGVALHGLSPSDSASLHALVGLSPDGGAPQLRLPRESAPADPGGASHAHEGVRLGRSTVHGQGVFATQLIPAGTRISTLTQGSEVSYTASKVNHSEQPNALPRKEGGELVLRTVTDLPPGSEVLGHYPHPK